MWILDTSTKKIYTENVLLGTNYIYFYDAVCRRLMNIKIAHACKENHVNTIFNKVRVTEVFRERVAYTSALH